MEVTKSVMWKRKRWEADFFRGSGSGREAFESSLPFCFRFPSASTKLETPVKCMFIFYPLNHSFFIGQCGPDRGDPSLKKIFVLDFDIFIVIIVTALMHWFQHCMIFCSAISVSGDIGKNMPRNAKIANFMFFGTFWTVFRQYLCLGTFHSKTLYRSGISAQRRSNWYP